MLQVWVTKYNSCQLGNTSIISSNLIRLKAFRSKNVFLRCNYSFLSDGNRRHFSNIDLGLQLVVRQKDAREAKHEYIQNSGQANMGVWCKGMSINEKPIKEAGD